ncbi:IclR family transcriptional regulator [Phytomonospora sp. NPDC050363]|uniref:IclR family transcriptional regulator n=1 Tax=Phytomonospora sp. NPDC050363 TaxID=3155642 RepID=UPI0033D096A0
MARHVGFLTLSTHFLSIPLHLLLGTAMPISHRRTELAGEFTAAEKILVLIGEMGSFTGPMGVSELARATSITKSTVHRLLITLLEAGVVHRVESGYALAAGTIWTRPGRLRYGQLVKVVKPFLLELYESTGRAAYLSVATEQGVLVLDSVHSHAYSRIALCTASVVPPHCTASGKVLLAFDTDLRRRFLRSGNLNALTRFTITDADRLRLELHAARSRGLAFDRQEHILGVCGAAAPLLRSNGRPLGAIALADRARDFSPREEVELRRVALAAGRAVSLGQP